MGVLLDISVVF